MSDIKEATLKLSGNTIAIILQALHEGPYKLVNEPIAEINAQLLPLLQPKPPEEPT